MATLHRWQAAPTTLASAIESLARTVPLEGVVAFLASPYRFHVTRADGSAALTGSDGRPVPLGSVFEARLFGPDAELRWLSTRERGRAVIIAENPLELEDTWRPMESLQAELLPGHYLLWGEGVDAPTLASGWSRLVAARIGTLDVPVSGVRPGQRARIESVEYLVEYEPHGNVAVADERLLRLVALADLPSHGVA